ncbi:MAG: helix-turn-helix domain-containing protein, partial [Ktedonobacteraceae bacterium]|nr:helix-turn-helix domain-containing protein [Ktedonobacteraceae bacterium]
MTSFDQSPFGELLHTFRKRKRLTQQRLADSIGMHRHAISRWELGDVLPASKAIVLELARCLHLNDQEARNLLEASLAAPAPLWGVPFPRNLFFTGRQETLAVLRSHLRVDRDDVLPQVAALHGLGGIGKTQIALEYAYRHALDYRAIFWVEAETPEHVWSSLLRMADLLQLPERTEMKQQRVVEAIQRWLTTHDQWLLIWDNLEDLELPQRLLPPGLRGTYLFTTRRQALGTLAQGITLPPMDLEEGMLLLLRRAKVLEQQAASEQVTQLRERMPAEYRAASQLVTMLGGLPLALDQAGAYLEETGCSL